MALLKYIFAIACVVLSAAANHDLPKIIVTSPQHNTEAVVVESCTL